MTTPSEVGTSQWVRHRNKLATRWAASKSDQAAAAEAARREPPPLRGPISLAADEKPTINTTKTAKPSTLALVAEQLGWREDRSPEAFDRQLPRAHVVWLVSQEELNKVLSSPMRRDNTRVSRIPGMHELCRKVSFARLLRDRGIDSGDAHLATWVLPDERPPPAAFRRGPLIVKPDDGSQGSGISVLTTPVELELMLQKMARKGDGSAVAQQYVDRPLLVDGYKFDLRLYVLVLSLSPLRVFLCKEGLVRVCSEPYLEPTDSTVREVRLRQNKLTRHLTNYGVSKHNDAHYDDADDPRDGSRGTKRTLSSTFEYLEARGEVSEDIWRKICELVRQTTLEMGRACRDERTEPELRLENLWERSGPRSGWPTAQAVPLPHGSHTRLVSESIRTVSNCWAWILSWRRMARRIFSKRTVGHHSDLTRSMWSDRHRRNHITCRHHVRLRWNSRRVGALPCLPMAMIVEEHRLWRFVKWPVEVRAAAVVAAVVARAVQSRWRRRRRRRRSSRPSWVRHGCEALGRRSAVAQLR
jgi:hypothetical protein